MHLRASFPRLALTCPLLILLACSADPSDGDGGDADGSGGAASGGNPATGGTTAGGGTGGFPSGGAPAGGASSGGTAAGGAGATGGSGTGADSGSGGATGGSDPGGTGGMTTGGCETADLLCETFEDFDAGTVPATGPWKGIASECQGGPFELGVSTDMAAEGTKSLKSTNSAWAQCRLAAEFGPVDDFWVTAHLYYDPAMDLTQKEVLMLELAPGDQLTSDGAAVRFGSRTKEPCTGSPGPQITLFNVGGGEQTGCSGDVPLPKGEWFCFEAHVDQSGPTDVKTYINGTGLTYLASGVTTPMESITSGGGGSVVKMDHVRVGLFSNATASGDAYIDALSVSTMRLGCD